MVGEGGNVVSGLRQFARAPLDEGMVVLFEGRAWGVLTGGVSKTARRGARVVLIRVVRKLARELVTMSRHRRAAPFPILSSHY